MAAAAPVRTARQVMTGFGRTWRSQSDGVGPVDHQRFQELIASSPQAGLPARGAGLSYGDAAQNGELADWRATKARLYPRVRFQSDLGRRVGLC